MTIYRNITQTAIFFVLTVCSTSIFEKLIDVNNTLKRIEYKLHNSNSFNGQSVEIEFNNIKNKELK